MFYFTMHSTHFSCLLGSRHFDNPSHSEWTICLCVCASGSVVQVAQWCKWLGGASGSVLQVARWCKWLSGASGSVVQVAQWCKWLGGVSGSVV